MLGFATTALVILMTPGPTNTLLAAYGASLGFRRAMPMVLAEAAGYACAITAFASLAASLTPSSLAALKLAAALWLLISARALWRTRQTAAVIPPRAFLRVLATTMVNPKAMVVGILLIPQGVWVEKAGFIGLFAILSVIAGLVWVAGGSMVPEGWRKHACRCAAVILSGFSVAAAASAFQ